MRVGGGGEHVLGVPTVHGLTGDLLRRAQLVASGQAVATVPARRPQGLDAHPVAASEPVHLGPDLDDPSHHLVPRDDGRKGRNAIGDPIALDHVQVRAAHPARGDLHHDLSRARMGIGHLGEVDDTTVERPRVVEDHGMHDAERIAGP